MNIDGKAYESRVAAEWTKIAGAPVRVEYIKGTFYGYTSELGALRLFHKYNLMSRKVGTAAAFSVNLGTWYFAMQTNFGAEA